MLFRSCGPAHMPHMPLISLVMTSPAHCAPFSSVRTAATAAWSLWGARSAHCSPYFQRRRSANWGGVVQRPPLLTLLLGSVLALSCLLLVQLSRATARMSSASSVPHLLAQALRRLGKDSRALHGKPSREQAATLHLSAVAGELESQLGGAVGERKPAPESDPRAAAAAAAQRAPPLQDLSFRKPLFTPAQRSVLLPCMPGTRAVCSQVNSPGHCSRSAHVRTHLVPEQLTTPSGRRRHEQQTQCSASTTRAHGSSTAT